MERETLKKIGTTASLGAMLASTLLLAFTKDDRTRQTATGLILATGFLFIGWTQLPVIKNAEKPAEKPAGENGK